MASGDNVVVGTHHANPYILSPEHVRAPPHTLAGRLRFLGPGMLTSAAAIGSGELIVTTTLGAQAGLALLWLVIIGTLVKVWIQIELARWTILTGKTSLDGYSSIGPRFRGLGILNVLWIVNEFPKLIQRGGILGGAAAACSLAIPVTGAPLSTSSMMFWVAVLAVGLAAVLYTNKYGFIERMATVSVLSLVVVTLLLALGLPLTPFAYTPDDIAYGLSFDVPAGALGLAVAMFGLTGFTAPEINNYGYWCIEKGYARWAGPDDGTEQRARRAEGWLKVMHVDMCVAWLVTTICTMSFYVIGGTVLHAQGIVPEGNDVIATLSRIYTDTLGEWAGPVFAVAAILTLGSTLLAVGAGIPRLWANTLGLIGLINWRDQAARLKVIRVFSVVLPSLWALSYFFFREPVLMVQIGGLADGLLLVAMVFAVWKLRTRDVPKRFRKSPLWSTALAVSSLAIATVGLVNIIEIFGITPG